MVAVDNFLTGCGTKCGASRSHTRFRFVQHDITQPLTVDGPVDAVVNMASPASPKDYLEHPIDTLDVGSAGTRNMLELARATGARFLLTSTSECYGDPFVHPQGETYWGNVNPVGPRSCYDESKRFAEALTMAYHRTYGLRTNIARIFNTYGPRMKLDDGRVVPAFIDQALRGEPITIFGDGSQTRSFCYVSDLVDGIYRLMRSDERYPVNLGQSERDDHPGIRGTHPAAHRKSVADRPAPAARRRSAAAPAGYFESAAAARLGAARGAGRRLAADARLFPIRRVNMASGRQSVIGATRFNPAPLAMSMTSAIGRKSKSFSPRTKIT